MQEEELRPVQETHKVILVDLDGANVIVTPLAVNVERESQKVIWVTKQHDWILTIDFQGGFPRINCKEKKGGCEATFTPGRPGKYKYTATVTLPNGAQHSLDPDLIILY